MDFSQAFSDFVSYIQDPTRLTDIHAFIFTTIILGSLLAGFTFFLRRVWSIIKSLYLQINYYGPLYGQYFLYNLAVVDGVATAPRASRLFVRRSLFSAVKITQENIRPRKELYRCSINEHYTALFLEMRSTDKSGDKYMILSQPRLVNDGNNTVMVGVMSSINFRGEPFSAPAIVTTKRMPVKSVKLALEELRDQGTTLDLSAINKATDAVEEADEGGTDDIFEYPHGTRGPA